MITNGPMNVTVCSGAKAEMSCELSSAFQTSPNWRIIKRNNSSNVISNKTLTEVDIANDHFDGLKGKDKPLNDYMVFSLIVGPVDKSYNNTSYQCIFTIKGTNNGTSNIIESTVGTITVINGTYV